MITVLTHGVVLTFKAALGWGMLVQSILGWYADHPEAANSPANGLPPQCQVVYTAQPHGAMTSVVTCRPGD